MKRELLLIVCFGLVACTAKPVQTLIPTLTQTSQEDRTIELEAAFQEARDTLDIFIQKIETPHPARTFAAVKTRFFPPDDVPQDIWVDEVTYSSGVLRGNMGDDIPSLKLEAGEKITVREEDILDWMIVEDSKLIGGYTIRLAVQRMTPEERERFLETLDYTIED